EIDLAYHGELGQLEYDFELHPRASAKAIRIQFPDAKSIRLGSAGELLLSGVNHTMSFPKPYIFQLESGQRRQIAGGYRVLSRNEIGFWIGKHDRSKPVVIDPVLIYSTNLPEEPQGVAIDSAGNTYITGRTQTADIVIHKLNATGTAFLYTTVL